jgi:hypothetical protein
MSRIATIPIDQRKKVTIFLAILSRAQTTATRAQTISKRPVTTVTMTSSYSICVKLGVQSVSKRFDLRICCQRRSQASSWQEDLT